MRMKPFLLSICPALLLLSPVAHATPPAQPERVEITAKRFAFTPAQVTLKRCQPVVIVLESVDVPHGLRFRNLGSDIKAGKGKTAEVPFTPTKVGDFTGQRSSFCGSRHGRMQLGLHV